MIWDDEWDDDDYKFTLYIDAVGSSKAIVDNDIQHRPGLD